MSNYQPIIPTELQSEEEKKLIRYNKLRKLKKGAKEDIVCRLW